MRRWRVRVVTEYRIEAIVDGEWHWFTGRHPCGISTWSKDKDRAEVFTSAREANRVARTMRGAYVNEQRQFQSGGLR